MPTHTSRPAAALARTLLAFVFVVATSVFAMSCKSSKTTSAKRAGGGKPAAKGSTPVAKGSPPAPAQAFGRIERKDPRFDKLVPPAAKIEKLADGFDWAEGPVWIADGYGDRGYLLFSDVPRNVIYKWKPGQAGVTEFLKPSGYTGDTPRGGEPGSNGLTLDPNRLLVLCEHGDRRVARLEADGKTKTALASHFQTKRFNSPNDACYDSRGNLFFTDPPYGLVGKMDDPAKEMDFQGVYRLSSDGQLTLLTRQMSRPNGLALSPDERVLYVANSDPEQPVWMAFDLSSDGRVSNGRVFFDATPLVKAGKKGNPDGMKVDQQGNLFATGPGGILVIAPDRTHLGTIDPGGQPTANCAWGGDGSTLYITADMNLCRLQTTTKGEGW